MSFWPRMPYLCFFGQELYKNYCEIWNQYPWICPTLSPAHLFVIRGKRKRDPKTLQTRDQNLPKYRAYFEK